MSFWKIPNHVGTLGCSDQTWLLPLLLAYWHGRTLQQTISPEVSIHTSLETQSIEESPMTSMFQEWKS